ncbi:MAG TPA: hypothetical protein VGD71_05405 [Kribbella sp.]
MLCGPAKTGCRAWWDPEPEALRQLNLRYDASALVARIECLLAEAVAQIFADDLQASLY